MIIDITEFNLVELSVEEVSGIVAKAITDAKSRQAGIGRKAARAIRGLNGYNVLCLGIRTPEEAIRVERSGFCGGYTWATGKSVFLPSQGSPFFDESGNHVNPTVTELNFAMARYRDLTGIVSGEYKTDGRVCVENCVPSAHIALIRVRVEHPDNSEKLRQYRQAAEKMLLQGIVERIEDLQPGRVYKYFGRTRG